MKRLPCEMAGVAYSAIQIIGRQKCVTSAECEIGIIAKCFDNQTATRVRIGLCVIGRQEMSKAKPAY